MYSHKSNVTVNDMSVDIFKSMLVGAPNVGKSSILRRYKFDEFSESYTATIGVDMSASTFDFPTGKVVLTLIDIGGQPAFTDVQNAFFAGTHHIIFIYDVTKESTFKRIPDLYELLSKKIYGGEAGFVSGSLVANKIDLGKKRIVTREDGILTSNILSLKYFEVSAKTGEGVSEVFTHAASECSHTEQPAIKGYL